METIILLDSKAKDVATDLSDENKNILKDIVGKDITQLEKENPGLLVFPDAFGQYGEEWNSDKLLVFEDNGKKLRAGNIAGCFGVGSLQIQIRSQFDKDNPDQYFFHYMLSRVMCMYMLDLPMGSGPEEIKNLQIYLFPFLLKRAVKQGIFRTYRTVERNDDHLCGAIDIPRHLRINTPFRGRIAYRTREYTGNNAVIHLIRHTIEEITSNPLTAELLTADEEIRTAVRTITELTPDYNRSDLPKIISKNLRPVNHPYYTEYAGLQNVCLKILCHENNTCNQSEDQLNGIIFRADWLWEEYLASILDKADCGLLRGKRKSKHPLESIRLYNTEDLTFNPDFFSDRLVMDAKYKRKSLAQKVSFEKEERLQMILYLYIQRAASGFLIYPSNEVEKTVIRYENDNNGVMNGYGGTLGSIFFLVPNNCSSFVDFQKKISESEEELIAIVKERNR